MISLEALKALIGQSEGIRKKDSFSCPELGFGVPRGAIIEITGPSRTEWVIRLLAENAEAQAAWIENELSILPPAIEQRAVRLDRILFFETKADLDWTVSNILRSQLFPIVVAPGSHDEKKLRRYQLLSEKSNTSLILLSEKPSRAWPVSLQVEARRREFRVLKRK